MPQIDTIEPELLKWRKHGSRAFVTELDSTLGVSRVTSKSRLTVLRAHGTILGFTLDVTHAQGDDPILTA